MRLTSFDERSVTIELSRKEFNEIWSLLGTINSQYDSIDSEIMNMKEDDVELLYDKIDAIDRDLNKDETATQQNYAASR